MQAKPVTDASFRSGCLRIIPTTASLNEMYRRCFWNPCSSWSERHSEYGALGAPFAIERGWVSIDKARHNEPFNPSCSFIRGNKRAAMLVRTAGVRTNRCPIAGFRKRCARSDGHAPKVERRRPGHDVQYALETSRLSLVTVSTEQLIKKK